MRGFTLIELMVVIAIMAILVVVAIPSYNEYNNNQKLAEAANNLQAVLRQTQNNAQTGTVCKSNLTGYRAPTWVIKLNSDRYSVYPSCDFSTAIAGTPTPTPVPQEYLLPSGVTISSVRNDSNCGILLDNTSAIINYTNLSSEPDFNSFDSALASPCPSKVFIIIKLSLNDSVTNIRTVKVEKGGGIYVEGQ